MAFAPTRSGKGVGLVIPTLLSWTGSAVVHDIKGENWQLTAGFRARFGRVLLFDPTNPQSAAYNPLLEVRRGDTEVRDVQNVADILVDAAGIADPKEKTYLVMDAEALLDVLEGGAGVVNSQYEAHVQHTDERKVIAGVPCRKSIVTVTYVSSIPLENDHVAVQQRNDIEVWHTSILVSSAANDHFFFKFQRDRTGQVQKAVASEIGFPMEVNVVVTQGSGRKSGQAAPGSLHMVVTEVRREPRLDAELFRIPPAGYRRIEKSPYFTAGALSEAGARIAREGAPKQ